MAGPAEPRRSWSPGRYRAPKQYPFAPGERGGRGEFIPGLGLARELPSKAADGGAIDSPYGARWDGPRKHRNARKKAEEGEGDEARSPA